MQRVIDLLGADEMDMAVDAAGGQDAALGGDDFCAGADDDGDAGLSVGVARLADGGDAAAFQADVGLVDPGPVEDQRVCDHSVHRPALAGDLGLPHAVADDLAAAEFNLLAIDGQVAFNLDDQIGVAEAHPVAGGRAEHIGISGARDFNWHQAPP